ncbi:hypothetical protein PspLS_09246 [Pyricularia sp. CBS 133598]|nr:hypothetical protein PspLS_09246 [Pyricularia sp. CBS 133598]
MIQPSSIGRIPVHQILFDKEKLHPINLTYIRSGEFVEAYDRVNHHKAHCINSWKVLTGAATRFSPQLPEVLLTGAGWHGRGVGTCCALQRRCLGAEREKQMEDGSFCQVLVRNRGLLHVESTGIARLLLVYCMVSLHGNRAAENQLA